VFKEQGADIGDFIDRMLSEKRRLQLFSALTMHERPETDRLVIIVDQFEEVFTECTDLDQRGAFIANLCQAASASEGKTIVILTMRDDFLGRCAEYPDLEAALSGSIELAPAMTDTELRRAIELPARRAGANVQHELTETLIRDMRHQAGALP